MCLDLAKAVTVMALLFSGQCFGIDGVKFDDRSSLFTVADKTVTIVTAKYVGWVENWAWAGASVKPDITAGKDKALGLAYKGMVRKLEMNFSSTTKRDDNQLIWKYSWDKKNDYPNAMGFGIEFNLKIDSPSFESPAQAAELLPGNQGWRWQTPDGGSVEVKFSPALAKIHFDPKKKHAIRAFFFTAINKGIEQTTMTVTVAGKKAQIFDPLTSNTRAEDADAWPKDILPDLVSPIDLSFLNANDLPAGKHGFVKAKGDNLVFEDGTLVKFWGANVMAYALFNTAENEIQAHAKRIAKLGLNLIRIHHHDSRWVGKNIFKDQANNTQEHSSDAFRKLDWWIKCLKDEGVYVWLDLNVGRKFTKNDGIDNFADMAKGKDGVEGKGFNYYNESVQKQMQRFNEAYLSHVNTFTKLAYKDDPAVFALLVTNENDLTQHFGNLFLPNKGHPINSSIFAKDVKQFSENSGLSEKNAGRAWEMGEPKIYLGDVEHRFNQKMLAHLHGFGAKSMIATTNSWGYMGLFGLPSLTDGDLIDTHSYGKPEEFNFNPRFNPSFLAWIGAAQVTGKPLSVTEWNVGPFPVVDRYTMPLYTASIASLQGWDAMMLYGYSQSPLGVKLRPRNSNWSSYNDPAVMGLMPAAALLYRQNHVSSAKQDFELKLSRDDFFFKKQDPTTSKAIRTLLETSRFTVTIPEIKELPWFKAIKPTTTATIVSDANKDFIPEGQDFVQSDTGELKRDWVKGIHTVNTAKSQIASGQIGGENIKLADVIFNISTKNAVVAVQSLDNKDLKNSKHIFITAMARNATNSDKGASFYSEPVTGTLLLSAPAGLTVYPINQLGERDKPLTANYQKGQYIFKFDEHSRANHWFELTGTDVQKKRAH